MKTLRTRLAPYSIFAAIFVAAWLFWEGISQPGMELWTGKIEEVAFYRNENNTGPIHRIYAAHVMDANFEDMQRYGNQMPYTKYGSTKVYFFSDRFHTPRELRVKVPHFDPELNPYCIAVYEKNSMGQVKLRHSPFD